MEHSTPYYLVMALFVLGLAWCSDPPAETPVHAPKPFSEMGRF